MNATTHVSSSRSLSLVLAATVLLGVDVAWSYYENSLLLFDARTLFAERFVASVLGEADGSWGDSQAWEDVGVPRGFPGVGSVRLETAERRGRRVLRVRATHRNASWSRSFVSSGRAISRRSETGNGLTAHDLRDAFDEREREKLPTLTALAIDSGVEVEPEDPRYETLAGYAALFGRTERNLQGHRVVVPTVGLSVRPDVALWLLAGVTFTLLVLIRSRIASVARDESLAEDEPWLVLDARRMLERALATAWLGMIVLGPWILNGLLVWSIGNRYWSEGIERVDGFGQAMAASVVLLIVATGWASLTAMSDILWLRRMRTGRWRASSRESGSLR